VSIVLGLYNIVLRVKGWGILMFQYQHENPRPTVDCMCLPAWPVQIILVSEAFDRQHSLMLLLVDLDAEHPANHPTVPADTYRPSSQQR
jgi:hypothetical protein